MAKVNAKLGFQVHEHLKKQGVENPCDWDRIHDDDRKDDIEKVMGEFCGRLGLSSTDPSTVGTPHRLAKMYVDEICWGLDYYLFPHAMTTPNEGNKDEIVLVRKIKVYSLCEHHLMPVIGEAHVAYLPNEKLLGLSKFNRIVDFFSRRPQLQERLGSQVLEALKFILDTEDVAVVIKARHLCVAFRGIQDHQSDTVTSHMSGKFFTEQSARAELMSLIKD